MDLRYVGWFMGMYIFIMIGFAQAFYCVFQLSENASSQYSDQWSVMFAVFSLWNGMGSPLDDIDVHEDFDGLQSTIRLLYTLFVLYVVAASIIMLNILIATMTNSNSTRNIVDPSERILLRASFRAERRLRNFRYGTSLWCLFYILKQYFAPFVIEKEMVNGNIRYMMRVPKKFIAESQTDCLADVSRHIAKLANSLEERQNASDQRQTEFLAGT